MIAIGELNKSWTCFVQSPADNELSIKSREGGRMKYEIKHWKKFMPLDAYPDEVKLAADFAWSMAFSPEGHHRSYRTGGSNHRDPITIFQNTFSGKLAELIVHRCLKALDIEVDGLNFDIYGEGKWDDFDIKANGKLISIKSCSFIGNLLLLEQGDYDQSGVYLPSGKAPDIHILARIKPDAKKIGKNATSDSIVGICKAEKWKVDVAGYATKEQLIQAINNNQIIKKDDLINGKKKMDANNYIIEAGKLIFPFNKITDDLRKEGSH